MENTSKTGCRDKMSQFLASIARGRSKRRRLLFVSYAVIQCLIALFIVSRIIRSDCPDMSKGGDRTITCMDVGTDTARHTQVMTFDNYDKQWNDTVQIDITERRFIASENSRVFIFGVVAKNSSPSNTFDTFAVYGQWYDFKNLKTASLRCCFKYADESIMEQIPVDMEVSNFPPQILQARLVLWHVTCSKRVSDPISVSVSRYSSCNHPSVSYIEPHYAIKRPDDHIVITTKFAYGYIDPELVVSFFETQRYLGVDKVITYVTSLLDARTERILRYYSYIGFLDYYTIELADSPRTKRSFPPNFDNQYISDEWLLKRDALERSIGSTYFGIFDMDEFLIPSKHRSYKALLKDLRSTFPNASSFFFPNVHYLRDVRLSDDYCKPNCSTFTRYVFAAPLYFNRIHEKYISITSRVDTKSVTNHYIAPLPGFTGGSCPNTEAYVRHYGKCRNFKFYIPWEHGYVCQEKHTWVKDLSTSQWSANTVNDIIHRTLSFFQPMQYSAL